MAVAKTVSPTVEQCKEKKAHLEQALTRLCYEFACETGLRVMDIDIEDMPQPTESVASGRMGNSIFYITPSVRVIVAL